MMLLFIIGYSQFNCIGQCLTTSGSANSNAPCHFPFSYYGQTYNECKKTSNYYWCATGPEYKSGAWGYCNDNCPPLASKLFKMNLDK